MCPILHRFSLFVRWIKKIKSGWLKEGLMMARKNVENVGVTIDWMENNLSGWWMECEEWEFGIAIGA